MVIIDDSPQKLNYYFNELNDFAKSSINVNFHPRKKLINKVFYLVKKWKTSSSQYDTKILLKFFKSINSYLGMLVNVRGANIQLALADMINSLFITLKYYNFKTCIVKV